MRNDKGTLPSGYNVGEDFIDNDIMLEIAGILMDGEVFIVQEVGAEKMRYLGGWAVAINNKEEYVRVTIDDIYKLAQGIIPEHMYIGKQLGDRQPIGTQITDVAY